MEREAGRPSLVRSDQTNVRATEARDQLADRPWVVGNGPPRLCRSRLLSYGDGNGGLVGIQPQKPRTLAHGTGLQRCISARDELRPPTQSTINVAPALPC